MKKARFKINNDTMTSIVVYSLLFCVAVTIAGLILGAYDHDVSSIVDSTHRVFGAELGICGIMKIFERRQAGKKAKAKEDETDIIDV